MDSLMLVGSTALALLSTATVSLIGKVIATDKALASHIASDLAMFGNFLDKFSDIKTEQRDQSQKLDRLIEQNMNRATDAAAARGQVSSAAATALDIVETAKKAALEVIAGAASEAKSRINHG